MTGSIQVSIGESEIIFVSEKQDQGSAQGVYTYQGYVKSYTVNFGKTFISPPSVTLSMDNGNCKSLSVRPVSWSKYTIPSVNVSTTGFTTNNTSSRSWTGVFSPTPPRIGSTGLINWTATGRA